MSSNLICLVCVIVLANSGLTAGQSCATACTMTYAMATFQHIDQATLICSDLTEYQNCVKDLTCMSQIEKSQHIEGARNDLLQRRNINCAITVCSSTVTEKCHLLFSNANPCGSFTQMAYCVHQLTCAQSEKQKIIDEIKSISPVSFCDSVLFSTTGRVTTASTTRKPTYYTTETTSRRSTWLPTVTTSRRPTWLPNYTTTSRVPNSNPEVCTNNLVSCTFSFLAAIMPSGLSRLQTCGDFIQLINHCVNPAPCTLSTKQVVVDLIKTQLSQNGITCGNTPLVTQVPPYVTPQYQDYTTTKLPRLIEIFVTALIKIY